MTSIEKAANIAAGWWASTIEGQPKQDNGDPQTAALMAILPRVNARPTKEQCEAFGAAMEAKLLTYMKDGNRVTIQHDYDPDMLLSECADKAGIKVQYCNTFPMKTRMHASDKKVEVSCGYGAPWETLWQPTEAAPC